MTELETRIRHLESLLAEEYGRPEWEGPQEPLDELVMTLLSHNVNDVNRDRAYQRLRERYATWEDAAQAPLEELAEAIRPAGFPMIKGARILEALRQVRARFGKTSLKELENWPDDAIREYLRPLPGVGPKTIACVLMFAMGRPAMPVDTHVGRITRRLGLVPEKASSEEAHALMDRMTPPDLMYAFHVEMIRHGRARCRPTHPKCETCPLAQDCLYYREHFENTQETEDYAGQ